MPELPEMEAWRRQLNDPVSAFPIAKAGPAHIATLKTFDPPLAALEGRRFRGAERRGKRLLFPTDDGELVLTENARRKQAGVWLLTPATVAAELGHLGPEALGLDERQLGEIVRSDSRRLHALLRDQRLIAGIGRAWANEILHGAELSPYALSTDLDDEEIERLATAMNEELIRGLAARERGATDAKAYRVHRKLGEPCDVCGTPIAQVDFESHTIFYCPGCQTGGRILKDRRLSRLLR